MVVAEVGTGNAATSFMYFDIMLVDCMDGNKQWRDINI